MKRTTIMLTDELWSLVDCEARRTGSSVSAVIRRALEDEYCVSDGTRLPPFVAMFNDPAMTPAAQVDDVIRRERGDAIIRGR